MTGFFHLLLTELKFQWRHGFIIAALVVTLVWALLLSILPQELRPFWFGIVASLDVTSIGLLFGYGLGVLDKNQQAISAIRLTPINSAYIALARIVSLSLLVMVTLVVLGAMVLESDALISFLPGIILFCIFFAVVGVTSSRRFANINQFILFFALSSLIWALPVLYYADIVTSLSWLALPSSGAMLLLKNVLTPISATMYIYAISSQLIWLAVIFYLGERWAPNNFLHRFGGH